MLLTSIGIGASMQQTLIAVQADCKDERDIPQKTGLVTFSRESKLFTSWSALSVRVS